jgi:hypothetical protein
MISADQKGLTSLRSNIHAKLGECRGPIRSEILFKQPERAHKAILRGKKMRGEDPCIDERVERDGEGKRCNIGTECFIFATLQHHLLQK